MHTPNITLTKFILKHLLTFNTYVAGILFATVLAGLTQVLPPYALKFIIDSLENNQPDSKLYFWITIYILLTIATALIWRAKDWLNMKLYPHLRREIVLEMFIYLQGHSYNYFQNRLAGSLSNKIADMNTGTIAILRILEEVGTVIMALLFGLVLMYFVSPIFSIILLGWTILFTIASMFFSKKIQILSKQFSESRSSLMGQIVDSLSNIVNVWLFARNKRESDRLSQHIEKTVSLDVATQWQVIKLRFMQDFTIIVLIGSMILTLAYQYKSDQISLGDLTFVMMSSIAIFQYVWWVASQMVEFVEEAGKCKQALGILSDPHEIKSEVGARDLVVKHASIEFKNVTFMHKKTTPLFADLSLKIKPGEKVGLVGFSGSGKTTLSNLILRFFDLNSGQILIDDQDISKVTLESLRRNISMIPQDPILFHRSLIDNIRYGKPEATDEEIYEAAAKAHCHSFIKDLPLGYETLVGERGVKVSGGQRQRIAIARAFLKNAPILILDEATSALDSVTEKVIQEALLDLMKDKTAVVIAHRLSTLHMMDRILVFDKGILREEGTHSDLVAKQGYYAKMWELQAGGFLPEEESDE